MRGFAFGFLFSVLFWAAFLGLIYAVSEVTQ